MKSSFIATLTSPCGAALVAACGSYPSTAYQSVGSAPATVNQGVQQGHVTRIDRVKLEGGQWCRL